MLRDKAQQRWPLRHTFQMEIIDVIGFSRVECCNLSNILKECCKDRDMPEYEILLPMRSRTEMFGISNVRLQRISNIFLRGKGSLERAENVSHTLDQ